MWCVLHPAPLLPAAGEKFVLQEISEFDPQFASLSEFDTGTVNSFSLGVSHLFSPFSLFYIFFTLQAT